MTYDASAHVAAREAAKEYAEQRVNLDELRRQWGDVEYRFLVREHVRKSGANLSRAVAGSVLVFNAAERPVAEVLIDEYNAMAQNRAFWHRSAAEMLDEIAEAFGERMSEAGLKPEGWLKFEVFQLITLNFAEMAYEQKRMRKFIGIRKGWLRR
ncbi:MAG: hypothetical protein R6X20_07335 [Phycisphaerae bacterium]